VLAALSVVWSSGGPAPGGSGPWAVVSYEGGGYMVNTESGEAWHLIGNTKVRVQERER
jgi:hypothetical protein